MSTAPTIFVPPRLHPPIIGFAAADSKSLRLPLMAPPASPPILIRGSFGNPPKIFFSQRSADGARIKDHRSQELNWRKANAERLRREFLGKWIVLEGDQIVACGSDPAQLAAEARRRGIRSPYIFRVEQEASPRTAFLGV
jgi:hypothetical protein